MPIDDVKTPVAVTTGTVVETAHPATGGEVVTEAAPDGAGGTTPLTPTATAGSGAHVGEDVNIVGGSVAATIGGTVATADAVLDATVSAGKVNVQGTLTASAAPDLVMSGTLSAATALATASAPGASTSSIVCSPLLSGYATAIFSCTGTEVGTLVVDATTDPTGAAANWINVAFGKIRAAAFTQVASVPSNVVPFDIVLAIAGFALVRVRCSAFTSGSTAIAGRVSAQPAGHGIVDSVAITASNTGQMTSILGAGLPLALAASGSLPTLDDNSLAALAAAQGTQTNAAAIAAQLPAALAAHGGLKIEGVASGVAIPITAASLPALSGTTAVSLASAPTTAVTAVGGGALATDAHMGGGLPAALGAGGGLKIDGSGTTLPVSMAAAPTGAALEAGHLATIDSHTPALGQALAAASVPVVLTAIQAAQLAQEAGNLAAILAALKTAGGSAVPSLGTTATGSLTLATGPVRVTAGSTGAIVLAGAANRRVFGLVSTYNPNQSVGVIVVVTIGTPAGSYPNLTNVLHAFALTAGNSGTPIYFGSVGGYPLPNGTDLYAMATTVATAQTDPTNEPFVNVIYGP